MTELISLGKSDIRECWLKKDCKCCRYFDGGNCHFYERKAKKPRGCSLYEEKKHG